MAAGTSFLEVPRNYFVVADDDDNDSSCSDYWSIPSDSCGIPDNELSDFDLEYRIHVLDSLNYHEKVSLMFLVCDDVKEALDTLLRPDPRVFSDWLIGQRNDIWELKIIGALCMIQDYEVLGHLVDEVTFQRMKSESQSADFSMGISIVRKNLYQMCENMSAEELEKVVEGMCVQCTGLSRRFSGEIMELNLLHWDYSGYISLGDSDGHVDLHMLKLVLEKIGKRDLLDSFDSRFLLMDGPSPPIVLSSSHPKRILSHGNVKVRTMLKSKRIKCSYDYDVDPKNVGICLIINQKKFYKETNPRYYNLLVRGELETRLGTDIDRDRLKEVFDSMGFVTFVEENLTHIEMLQKLEYYVTTKVNIQHSCFVLCILSHGLEGMVCGVNSVAVYESELENVLKRAPVLITKPKVMILQACQGEDFQQVFFAEHSGSSSSDLALDGPALQGRGESADIITFWSTVPGFASIRDTINGSWFVESLWQHFLEDHKTEDICTLFTKVTFDLSTSWADIDGNCKTMVPRYNSSLTMQLVLSHHPEAKYKVALHLIQRFFFQKLLEEYILRLRVTKEGLYFHIHL